MSFAFDDNKYLVLKTEDIIKVSMKFPHAFKEFKGFVSEVCFYREVLGKSGELRGIFINEDTGSLYEDVKSRLEGYMSLMGDPSVFGKTLANCGTDIYEWLKTDEPQKLFTVGQLSEVVSSYNERNEHLKKKKS